MTCLNLKNQEVWFLSLKQNLTCVSGPKKCYSRSLKSHCKALKCPTKPQITFTGCNHFSLWFVGEKTPTMLWSYTRNMLGRLLTPCPKTGTVEQLTLLAVFDLHLHQKYDASHPACLCSVIGTSSLRRAAQLKKRFPHLEFKDIVSF